MYALLMILVVVTLTELIAVSYGEVNWSICDSSEFLEPTRFGTSIPARMLNNMLQHGSLVYIAIKSPFLLSIIITKRKWTAISAFIFMMIQTIFFAGHWHDCDRKGCETCTAFFFLHVILLPFGLNLLVYALITRFFFDRGKYNSP